LIALPVERQEALHLGHRRARFGAAAPAVMELVSSTPPSGAMPATGAGVRWSTLVFIMLYRSDMNRRRFLQSGKHLHPSGAETDREAANLVQSKVDLQ
jgi:hypothetical protein